MLDDPYAEWPTLDIKRTAGAYLYATNGKVICFLKPDGTREWTHGMEAETVASWESFGVHDPIEQHKLDNELSKLINNFATKRSM
jgi:hypothetical protein